jgi:hypothetical protein
MGNATEDGLDEEAIDAATDYLATCGNHYGWWPELVWRDLDPIGRDEFAAIAANMIRAYLRVAEIDLADLDAVVAYAILQNWPCCSEFERKVKPLWSDKLAKAQSAALQRHRDRFKP